MVFPLEAKRHAAIQWAYCFSWKKADFKTELNYQEMKKGALDGGLTVSHRSQISFMPSATGISSLMLNF